MPGFRQSKERLALIMAQDVPGNVLRRDDTLDVDADRPFRKGDGAQRRSAGKADPYIGILDDRRPPLGLSHDEGLWSGVEKVANKRTDGPPTGKESLGIGMTV